MLSAPRLCKVRLRAPQWQPGKHGPSILFLNGFPCGSLCSASPTLDDGAPATAVVAGLGRLHWAMHIGGVRVDAAAPEDIRRRGWFRELLASESPAPDVGALAAAAAAGKV